MKNQRIKIAFFGTPDRAVVVLEALRSSGLAPSLIVTQPDRPVGRKMVVAPPPAKIWAEDNSIEVLQPENLDDASFVRTLRDGGYDIFVVVAYGKILKQNILDIPRLGCLNLHASLLPRLRGSSPIETAILTDERKTGVTIILMDSLMDHGPILAQEELRSEKWPVPVTELSRALLDLGGRLMARTIPSFVDGSIQPVEQDHRQATVAKKIKKEDGLIDLSADGYKNYLKFLAYMEWPTSYFFATKDGKKVRTIITDASFEDGRFMIKKVIPEGKKEILFEEFKKNYRI